jgi:hypothetical protein
MQHGTQKGLAGREAVTVMTFLGENALNVLRLFVFVFQQSNAH